MKLFSDLLRDLVFSPSRNRKLYLIGEYLRQSPDPDRGYAIAAISGDLKMPSVQPSLLRKIVTENYDEQLFKYSYDFVGDLAETIALIWDELGQNDEAGQEFSLSHVVENLSQCSKRELPELVKSYLSRMDASQRYALIKLATGGFRIGVSSRLVKQAIAQYGSVPVNDIEELWHGLKPPYLDLFLWLDGKADKPVSKALAPFRPVMLSHALEERDYSIVTGDDYLAEWKWDGIRVQLTNDKGVRKLYSRTGDEISAAFPDVIESADVEGTFDGELLVRSPLREPLAIRSFSDLQQRLNRKTVSNAMLSTHPAFFKAYDILLYKGQDLRDLGLTERRKYLEEAITLFSPDRADLSSVISFSDIEELMALRSNPPDSYIEGLMLKRKDAPYLGGRPRGPWFKWKRDPRIIDAVLMYAQHGHGKRSGFYSDFTFGCWRNADGVDELVPVGKAYFGFTDDELKLLDKFVRANTVERFGPVRSIAADKSKGLVLEIAFEGINRSSRHKSGVAMRFPRISRIRWDKPTAEADWLSTLEKMID